MATTIVDGFEDGFYTYNGEGEMTCPMGWFPVWVDDPRDGVLDRPEWKPAGTAQVRTGTGAVAIHSRYSTIDGALVRTYEVEPGSELTASVWMLKTEDASGHSMQIGIDPTGGTLITSGNVVWSEWYSQHMPDYAVNKWRPRTVEAVAESNLITVFLRSKVDVAVNSSNAHFDDFALTVDEPETEPEPEPEPEPDATYTVDVPINGTARVTLSIDLEVVDAEFIPAAPNLLQRILGR